MSADAAWAWTVFVEMSSSGLAARARSAAASTMDRLSSAIPSATRATDSAG